MGGGGGGEFLANLKLPLALERKNLLSAASGA